MLLLRIHITISETSRMCITYDTHRHSMNCTHRPVACAPWWAVC